MRGALAGLLLLWSTVVWSTVAWADQSVRDLSRALQLPQMARVLQRTGLEFGLGFDEGWLDGQGGALWQDRVGSIYAPGRYLEGFEQALDRHLSPEQRHALLSYYVTPRGQQAVALERAAFAAYQDPDVSDAAQMMAAGIDSSDPLVQAAGRLIAALDLVERNTAASINSQLALLRGLDQAGASGFGSAAQAQVWAQEPEIRADAAEWLAGFYVLSLQPLSAEARDAYVHISESPAGLALNAALFEGYVAVNRQMSRELGAALAAALTASSL